MTETLRVFAPFEGLGGADGDPWDPNVVITSFYEAAAKQYDREEYELVFPQLDYPLEERA